MKYIVLLKQKNEGCDYSIGCGMRFDEVEAESDEDLVEKVIWPECKESYSILECEEKIAVFMFAPANTFKTVDIDSILKHIESNKKEVENNATYNTERAEYDRLKRKFG